MRKIMEALPKERREGLREKIRRSMAMYHQGGDGEEKEEEEEPAPELWGGKGREVPGWIMEDFRWGKVKFCLEDHLEKKSCEHFVNIFRSIYCFTQFTYCMNNNSIFFPCKNSRSARLPTSVLDVACNGQLFLQSQVEEEKEESSHIFAREMMEETISQILSMSEGGEEREVRLHTR